MQEYHTIHTNILRNSKRILRYSQNVCLGDDQASFDRLIAGNILTLSLLILDSVSPSQSGFP